MADDDTQRPFRPADTRAPAQGPSSSGNDPLAELARLIGQSDPFGEFGRDNARRAAPAPVAEWTLPNHPAFTPVSANVPPTQPDIPQQLPFGAPEFEPQRFTAQSDTDDAGAYRAEGDFAGGQVPGYSADGGADGGEHDAEHEGFREGFYDDGAPQRRRMSVIAIAAVFGLAIVGTATAIGYRALFGSSGSHMPPPVIEADTAPSKIVPSSSSKDAASNKLITDRIADSGRNEKLVSREEQPVDVKEEAPPLAPSQNAQVSAPLMPPNGSGIVAAEPKKIKTIVIHPDQIADAPPSSSPPARVEAPSMPPPAIKPAAPPQRVVNVPAPEPKPAAAAMPAESRPAPAAAPVHSAASSNAPLSLAPGGNAAPARAAAAPSRTAALTAAPVRPAPQAASGGGYAVQVSSQRSEAEAQAAFKSMQAKYPNQLGGRSPIIHRVDLGAKGIYFRAMVGPFGTSAEASSLCSSLKAAGGQCLVQKI
jgi:hypothetical protein